MIFVTLKFLNKNIFKVRPVQFVVIKLRVFSNYKSLLLRRSEIKVFNAVFHSNSWNKDMGVVLDCEEIRTKTVVYIDNGFRTFSDSTVTKDVGPVTGIQYAVRNVFMGYRCRQLEHTGPSRKCAHARYSLSNLLDLLFL